MKTTLITREEGLKRRVWYLIDAEGLILGRMCVHIANLLRGKNKADFTSNQDCGDYVVVINASKVRLTGDKKDREIWYRHSGYPGGLKSRNGREMVEKYSRKLVYGAVKGMMPKNKSLSHALLRKLKIYEKGEYSGHDAQKLINYEIK